jgi:hypothetical protein
VPLAQWRVAETLLNRVALSRIDASDRCLIALPLHSSAGIRRALAGLGSGGSIICPGAIAADATIEVLESLAPTQYFAPPASHIARARAFNATPRPRHCPRTIWGGTTDLPEAPFPPGAGIRRAGDRRLRNHRIGQHRADTLSPPVMDAGRISGLATNIENRDRRRCRAAARF